MPRILSDTDVADFRERLCQAAEKLFAERGAEAVTMRQLAAALGVSPMTPYRYFQDKDDILAAIRTNGFNRFAAALEEARDHAEGASAKGKAVGEAYVTFALSHPHSYKLMFDFNQPNLENYPELAIAGERARATMTGFVNDAFAEGVISGDAEQIGMMFWAAVHGAVVLELSGMLPPGAARRLQHNLDTTLSRGLRAKA